MQNNDLLHKKLCDLFFNPNGGFRDIRPVNLEVEELEYFAKKAAIGMAHRLYRNGAIEDFHASSCDKANIPDSVMKVINKDVCNKCYAFVMDGLCSDAFISNAFITSYLTGHAYGIDWDEPSLVPHQLEVIYSVILKDDDNDWSNTGVELMVTHKETQKQFLMFFVFEGDFNTVIPYEMEAGPLEQRPYTFREFIEAMTDDYTIESYSIEYRSDLLDESDECDEDSEFDEETLEALDEIQKQLHEE